MPCIVAGASGLLQPLEFSYIEIDDYINDALFSALGSHGFIRKLNVSNHWYLEDYQT